MKITRYILLAAITMMAAACNRGVELLDTIPSDVDAVARVDISRLVAESGRSLPADITDRINGLKGAVDLSETFMVVDAGGRDVWLTGYVTDEDSLRLALGQPAEKDADGFSAYGGDGTIKAFTRGRQIWITGGSSKGTPAAMVRKATDPDGDGSIDKVPGVGDFLRRDMLAGIVIAGHSFTDQWQCIEMKIDHNALLFDHFRVNQEGMIAPTSGLEPINTRFLSYAPQPSALILAAGIDKDNVDWDGIGKAVGAVGGFTYYGFYEAILPFLREIDGTISIATAPSDGNLLGAIDAGTTHFILMAQMPEAAAVKAIQTVSAYVGRIGLPVSKSPDGAIAVSYGTLRFHAAYIDGCLTISNFVPEKVAPDENLVRMLKGKLGVGMLTVDRATVEQLIQSADFGLQVTAEAGNTHNTLTLRLTECGDAPILPTLIRIFSNL